MSAMQQLAAARVYLCTDAREKQGDLPEFLDAVLAGGVDVVQLRQKEMAARDELAALEIVADACARHGRLFSVNDRADLAYSARADILHLGQGDLPVNDARWLLGSGVLIGRSTHDREQVDDALADPCVDYFCVGPTWATPTKPGRPAAGLELVRYAAGRSPRPWFAIGGVDLGSLDEVLEAGARRVVVVRAITEAADPAQAARELAARVRAAGPV